MAAIARSLSVPVTSALAVSMMVSGQSASAAMLPATGTAGSAGALDAALPAANPATRTVLPLKPQSYRYSSEHGPRCIPVVGGSTWHLGQDLGAANNDPIFVVADGTVTRTSNGTSSSSGYIVVKHVIGGKTYHTVYVHMWNATTHVRAGSVVKAGQQIGLVGSSGPSTGPHLHFEVWEGAWYTGKSLEPSDWLAARGVSLKGNATTVYNFTTPSQCNYAARYGTTLRAQPSAGAATLASVAAGALMTGYAGELTNGYAKVVVNGFTGWIPHLSIKPSSTPAPAAPAPADTVSTAASGKYKATANVNIRSGAGTGHAILKVLPKGATVSVSARSGAWYKVSYSGTSGWVAGSYLSKAASTSSASTSAATHKTTANLNLRTGAGTTHSVLKVLVKGTSVAVLSTSGSWAKVKAGTATGWVAKAFLKANATASGTTSSTSSSSPASSAPAKSTTASATHKTTATVNLRSGAGTGYAILETLGSGSKVASLSTSGTWTKVKAGTKTGWIATRYLSAISTTTTKSLPPTSYRTTTDVNVRRAASWSQPVVKIVAKGKAVTVDASYGSWLRVTYGSVRGWVPATYLEKDATAAPKAAAGTKTTTARVNFRSGPGTSYASRGLISAGVKVKATGATGSWTRVVYAGKAGYISSAYLK